MQHVKRKKKEKNIWLFIKEKQFCVKVKMTDWAKLIENKLKTGKDVGVKYVLIT